MTTNYSEERRLHNYDRTKSTEENYECSECNFIGKFKLVREMLDYNFHARYT